MKKQTRIISVEIPEGYEFVKFNSERLEIVINRKLSVTDRIKTIDDVLDDHGLTQSEINHKFSGVPEHLKYQYIAELLCESLNEGWKADWSCGDQRKYYPWFVMSGSLGFRIDFCANWDMDSAVGSRLCLKSHKLAKYAGAQFTELYEKFMIKVSS